MKWTLIFWIIYLLSACDYVATRPVSTQTFHQVPDSWHASGRLGVVFAGRRQNAGFVVDFNGQNYQLILTGTLGLGQMVIESTPQGLQVDGNATMLSFKQWMRAKTNWYFPIGDLGKIAFNQAFVNPDWQLKVLTRYPNRLPKIIRLTHRIDNIKIKLIFKNINQNATKILTDHDKVFAGVCNVA